MNTDMPTAGQSDPPGGFLADAKGEKSGPATADDVESCGHNFALDAAA